MDFLVKNKHLLWIRIEALIISLSALLSVQYVSSAVLYEKSFIGENVTLDQGASFYTYYFEGYSTLSNPPTGVSYWVVTGTPATVRIKRISGAPCSALQSNSGFGDDTGNSFGGLGVGVANGQFCDFPLTGVSNGDHLAYFYVNAGGSPNDIVLDGSSLNGGRSVNGFNNADTIGGFAFQICDSGGCSGGFTHAMNPSHAKSLNDTGITTYGNATSNTLPTEPTDYPGQDASYGRDVAAQAGMLNKIGGGRAGFDFTKLDANGNDLPASAVSWTCVRDNVTGMVWEVKTDDGGLRDKDNYYTWYNQDNTSNGGYAGTQNGGACVGSINCDTYGYTQAVNSQNLCGCNDWRLPWQEELRSIVDYSIPYPGPTIDTNYFPNTMNGLFYSASPFANNSVYVWSVNFNNGNDGEDDKDSYSHVRLVCGRAP